MTLRRDETLRFGFLRISVSSESLLESCGALSMRPEFGLPLPDLSCILYYWVAPNYTITLYAFFYIVGPVSK